MAQEKKKRKCKIVILDQDQYVDRYALTLGEQSEIHVGCPIIGDGLAEEGFTVEELVKFSKEFKDSKLVLLHKELPKNKQKGNEAAVLLIKGGVNTIMKDEFYADKMMKEQDSIKYDKFYFDSRRKKKFNKIARHNTIFSSVSIEHNEDYSQSTVIGYNRVPYFAKLRARLPEVFGKKAEALNSEGNHYYDKKCGISWHGDGERKKVICCSLGTPTMLKFYWRQPKESIPCSKIFEFYVEHGDIYIMSGKATGWDWLKRSKYRVVHAAGAEKYVKIK